MSESPLTDCASCGDSRLRRKIGTGAGFIFKGGGFYETDFKDKKGTKEEAAPASGTAADASSNKTPAAEPAAAPKTTGSAAPVAATSSTD